LPNVIKIIEKIMKNSECIWRGI